MHTIRNAALALLLCVAIDCAAVPELDLVATLTNPFDGFGHDGSAGDEFGYRVAVDGNWAVVRAIDDDGPWGFGSFYFYKHDGTQWNLQQKLPVHCYGESRSSSGVNLVLQGEWMAFDCNEATEYLGRVHLLRRVGDTWSQTDLIAPGDGYDRKEFGDALALDGNLLVAGSSVHQIDAGNPGAAFVYRIDADGKAEEIARLTNELDGGIYGSYFGGAVSVHGSTVVVGASGHGGAGPAGSGAAYVFECTQICTPVKVLRGSNASAQDNFGSAVALSSTGNTLFVGAPGEDLKFCPDGSSPDANSVCSGGGSVTSLCSYDCGGIYVFDRNGGLWTEAKLHIASDRASNDELGSRLRARGDEVIAFAGSYSNPKHLYVLKAVAGGVEERYVEPPVGLAMQSSFFGLDFGLALDRLLVGVPGRTVDINAGQGSVLAYERNAAGEWTVAQELAMGRGGAEDEFGYSVHASDGWLIAGAPKHDEPAANQGAAWILASDAPYAVAAKLLAPDAASGDQFGWSVAISATHAVVGAPLRESDFKPNQGAAYVFRRDGAQWKFQQQLFSPTMASNERFGEAVAIESGRLWIGTPGAARVGGPQREGLVFEFVEQAGAWVRPIRGPRSRRSPMPNSVQRSRRMLATSRSAHRDGTRARTPTTARSK